jgi:hypothetical protein
MVGRSVVGAAVKKRKFGSHLARGFTNFFESQQEMAGKPVYSDESDDGEDAALYGAY